MNERLELAGIGAIFAAELKGNANFQTDCAKLAALQAQNVKTYAKAANNAKTAVESKTTGILKGGCMEHLTDAEREIVNQANAHGLYLVQISKKRYAIASRWSLCSWFVNDNELTHAYYHLKIVEGWERLTLAEATAYMAEHTRVKAGILKGG
jgi:hypothetical protein